MNYPLKRKRFKPGGYTCLHWDFVIAVFGHAVLCGDDEYIVTYKGIDIRLLYKSREIRVTYSLKPFDSDIIVKPFDSKRVITNDYSLEAVKDGAHEYFSGILKQLIKERQEVEQRITLWGVINDTHFSDSNGDEVQEPEGQFTFDNLPTGMQ